MPQGLFLLTCLLALFPLVSGYNGSAPANGPKYEQIRVISYNVENLFDTLDDPITHDEEFMPGTEKQWTGERYHKKLKMLSQVIHDAMGDQHSLVGLIEVENREVLEDLISTELLKEYSFQIVHRNSPDARGIDVALLVPDNIKIMEREFLNITLPEDSLFRTRDVLLARLYWEGTEFWCSVNHFPSRRGGEEASAPKRALVASWLKYFTDSIHRKEPQMPFVIMGDFNDEPTDSSLYQVLGATSPKEKGELVNLMWGLHLDKKGTYNYRGNWNMLDQFIVSRSLTDSTAVLHVGGDGATIITADHLLEQQGRYAGNPWRTYAGNHYLGGYSDHLPIRMTLYLKQ